ncbi:MAG: hypothetical protein ACK4K3_07460 [Aquabacterium sp.]
MANATPLRIGQINGSGDTDALFLKVFSGETLTAFETASKTRDKHFVRTITSGKSAQFPATWKVTGGYHTPGAEIVGQSSNVNERVITIDDLLISSVFIPNIDEAKNHFDYRSVYSKECGVFLGTNWDKNVLQVMVLAARASATVTGAFGGTSLTSTGTLYKTSAADLIAGHYAAAQAMDEKDIPETSRKYSYMRPAQYYLLAQVDNLVDKDLNNNNGDKAKAKVYEVAGIELVKTNNLPNTVISDGPVAYRGDFTKTSAVITTADAVGTVKLMDLQTEMEYDMRRQGTLIVAKYLMGHGILRPECAVELRTTN